MCSKARAAAVRDQWALSSCARWVSSRRSVAPAIAGSSCARVLTPTIGTRVTTCRGPPTARHRRRRPARRGAPDPIVPRTPSSLARPHRDPADAMPRSATCPRTAVLPTARRTRPGRGMGSLKPFVSAVAPRIAGDPPAHVGRRKRPLGRSWRRRAFATRRPISAVREHSYRVPEARTEGSASRSHASAAGRHTTCPFMDGSRYSSAAAGGGCQGRRPSAVGVLPI